MKQPCWALVTTLACTTIASQILQQLPPCAAFSLAMRAAAVRKSVGSPTASPTEGLWGGVTSGRRGTAVSGVGERLGPLSATAGMGLGQTEEMQEKQSAGDNNRGQGFEWTRQWYPVVVMRDLEAMDPRKPYPVQLLGEALVVWKDPKAGWKAFADRCPHRWAPLSEGRVDQTTGRLQCIYHGWEFEGDGKCGSIPQANADVRDSAQNSRRACATIIPTKVVQGKLWLWPDTSPDGVEASETVLPVTVPEFDSEDFGGNWYARDLNYGFDTLIENFSDPAHVPFAHHGVMGSRALGTPMGMVLEEGTAGAQDEFKTGETGFAGLRNMVVGFQAPGMIYYRSDYTEILPAMVKRLPPPLKALVWTVNKFKLDKRMSLKPEDRKEPSDRLMGMFVGYAVPTRPGRCKVFTRQSRNFMMQHPVIPRRWRNSLANEHLLQHLAFDGDTPALHMQERFLSGEGKHGLANAEQVFFMPTDCDTAVRAFRKWYNSRGGGGPPWAKGIDPTVLGPVLPREELLDRMDGHTKDCAACSKAYRVSNKVKRVSIGGTVLLLAAAAVAPRGPLALCLAGGAVASSGLARAMAKRGQRFVFLDYVHATRDG